MEMLDKLKTFLGTDSHFYGLVLLLVSVAAFGMGRLSWSSVVSNQQPARIIFSSSTQPQSIVATDNSEVSETKPLGQYVASKKGSKYHLPWCPGAKQMNEDNKIWFSTTKEAEAAGYTPAANCPGL